MQGNMYTSQSFWSLCDWTQTLSNMWLVYAMGWSILPLLWI